LLVLVHECGALARQGLMARAQRAILVLQLLEDRNQLLDPLAETRQFELEFCFF